jgi:hypothetical protein
MKKANVAISIAVTDPGSVWSSGLNQNLAFLGQLLRASPAVGKVWLVQPGVEPKPEGLGFTGFDLPLVRPEDITFDVDLVIELGCTLPVEWLKRVRALGAKVTALLVGQTYPGQAELTIFNRTGGSAFVGTPWDELWTLPHHMKTSAPFLRTVSRVPVLSMPYLWSPLFLEEPIRRVTAAGHRFGFQPDKRGAKKRPWRLAIFEPNISVVKSCFIPMLLCDEAYRTTKDCVGLMMVLNTFHMKEHRTFNAFAAHMDLTRDSKASYEPRLPFVETMAEHRMDGVVAHQWECGLNNLYFDALHGGYPLVHNSEFLRDGGVGFFYPDFKAIEGAKALLDAWRHEPGFWQDYKRNADAYLARMSPRHPDNIDVFTRRIAALTGHESGERLEA